MSQSLNAAQRKIIFNALSVLKREGYGKKCFVDKTPFDGDEDEAINCVQENQINYVEIHLRLLPQSVPFNEGAFKAILSIPHDFPLRPPKIRVITPIHHPNIGPEGIYSSKERENLADLVSPLRRSDVLDTAAGQRPVDADKHVNRRR